ncbi:MAG: UDP-N-acetylmuramate dehydrogenase [Prevotellaceae bacterium]|jgi:UDP-N-acetylmuramate dehydrogenase|nr:UDP-N-acetylmuramate dehydrogenase [Prevotellaceae bacterium]
MSEIIQTGYRLKDTFGFEITAQYFSAPKTSAEIKKLLGDFAGTPVLVVGGCSNMVLAENFEGLVINPQIKHIKMRTKDDLVYLKVGAGVMLDDFVRFTCENNYSGAENLSGIPGNVGAAPVQNAGAYGTALGDIITAVEGFFIDSMKRFKFSITDCKFGYRDSIFKNELRQKTVIDSVTFGLTTKNHSFYLDYGDLKEQVQKRGKITPLTIRETILDIRSSKLPDPVQLGNAGSFFKNPLVDKKQAMYLSDIYPEMPVFLTEDGIKLSAAWLIDRAGLKGARSGNVGLYPQQPLVIVNYGGATVDELLNFSKFVQQTVHSRFNVSLEPEVNIIGHV